MSLINAPHCDYNVAPADFQSELSSVSGRHRCGGVDFGAIIYSVCEVLFRTLREIYNRVGWVGSYCVLEPALLSMVR